MDHHFYVCFSKEILSQLGHHSAAFTFDVYGHFLPGGNKEAVDSLDKITKNAIKCILCASTKNADKSLFS